MAFGSNSNWDHSPAVVWKSVTDGELFFTAMFKGDKPAEDNENGIKVLSREYRTSDNTLVGVFDVPQTISQKWILWANGTKNVKRNNMKTKGAIFNGLPKWIFVFLNFISPWLSKFVITFFSWVM